MLNVLVLVAAGATAWWIFSPSLRFLRGFGALLDSAATQTGPLQLLTNTLSASGRFGGRAVRMRVIGSREESPGRIEIEVAVRAPDGAPWKDSRATTADPRLSRATFDLEGRFELILTLQGGWLQATWTPLRLTFPGPFDPARWRTTLEQLQVLAEWLEARPRGSA